MATEGTLEIGGAQVWWRVEGEGPDLVLVHAGAADSRMWDGVMGALDGRMRCIRFDMRGFGRTCSPAGPFSPAADQEAALAALDVGDAVVVGSSFGGLVALEHAVAHPRRVRRLVLLDPALPGQPWSEEMTRFGEDEDAALEAGHVDEAVELNVAMWAPDATRAQQDLVRDMQRRAFQLQLEVDTEPLNLDPPVSERLGECRMPVLVAYGASDVSDFVAIAHRLARELPDATLMKIDGAGHLPPLEQPVVVARAILATSA